VLRQAQSHRQFPIPLGRKLAAGQPMIRVVNTPLLAAGCFMCAWHDAQADLLVEAGSKTPAVTGRKGYANKARALSETRCLEEA